jgi:hypothetical protein
MAIKQLPFLAANLAGAEMQLLVDQAGQAHCPVPQNMQFEP